MSQSQFHLFRTRRFLPLFLTQFLGALNDNLFKNALVLLIVYRLAEQSGQNGQVLVTAAAGIFILPFFLFSATAGQIADRFEKSRLIKIIKLVEVAIMALGAYGLFYGDAIFQIGVLFLMGTQSAFFGPIKYSIIPDYLKEDEIVAANGLVEAGTFLAILVGTIAGGLLILQDGGPVAVSGAILVCAAAGVAASLFLPKTAVAAPGLKINWNVFGETLRLMQASRDNRDVFLSILGISWFWLVGATFLSQFPAFAKDVLAADETVVTLFLTLFSIGIGVGSLLCNRLLAGKISAKYVPLGALAMTVFILDLHAATATPVEREALIGAMAFLADPVNWRVMADLVGIAVAGGLYIVPLYAILQTRSVEAERSRTIAANNIINAAFMVAGALAATAMLAAGTPVTDVFLTIAVVNGLVALYICKLLPDAIVKAILVTILKLCYRVEIKGLENYAKAGPRAVIVVNHVSFLDAVLLAAYLPVKPMFAIDTQIAKAWWVKPFLSLVDAFPMDPTNPMATKALIKRVREDRHCVIFPEGRITVTGTLMKVYEGPGMVADKADAMLVPIRIDGAQYTPFSRLKGKVRLHWFPKITLTVLEPQRFALPEGTTGRARRQMAATMLYDVMSEMIFATCDHDQTLFDALLDACHIHGRSSPIIVDADRKPMTYSKLVLGALVLGAKFRALAKPGERVGLLLPNAVGTVVTFFGLQAFGRVPAMLNFSTGLGNMQAAMTAAEIKTVITSKRFVELAKMDDTIAALGADARIVYLEDLRRTIGPLAKLTGLLRRLFAATWHKRLKITPDDPAVVLFTSGSEGTPKGVVLSHANLLANRHQLGARLDFNAADQVFNALPMFHSFGLTGGTLLPVLSGVKTFLYPSPLHYRIVPALVYDTGATILFGTDTFLSGYARVAHPYDFFSVRYVFAGAEKVREETRRTWSDKFGVRILEGYGATETAPVIAVNTPIHFKVGTVGRIMPGIEHHLEAVPGIEEGGRLVVSGPNIMLGYLRVENPGKIEAPEGGQYDTGDIVTIDEQGFVTIQGRAKRFAKIAGEMVSLGAVEQAAAQVWPGHAHAAVALPDPKKGEQVILVTDFADAKRDALLAHAREAGLSELMVPKDIRVVDALPLLGTGKIDHVALKKLVEAAA